MKTIFISLLLTLLISSSATKFNSHQNFKYPDEFPPDVLESTQNVEAIVANYHFRDSTEFLGKKPSWYKRSRESIMKTVMPNLDKLRFAYNKRLVDRPGLFGTITVNITILENGIVQSAIVSSSTMADDKLEYEVTRKITNWQFDKKIESVDTTNVIYPFTFTQGQSSIDLLNLRIKATKKGDRSANQIVETIESLKDSIAP